MSMTEGQHLQIILRLGDDALVLGQRLSAWCGHGPVLEEDIALSNTALDLIGQARNFYTLAAAREDQGRDEDQLAFFRTDKEFKITSSSNSPTAISVIPSCVSSSSARLRWSAAPSFASIGRRRGCGHCRQSRKRTAVPLGARCTMDRSTRRRDNGKS